MYICVQVESTRIKGVQTRSWRAGVLQSLAPTLTKHSFKFLLDILEYFRQVCWGKLELNCAGPSLDTPVLDDFKNAIKKRQGSDTIFFSTVAFARKKNTLMMDLFLTNKQLFTSQDV